MNPRLLPEPDELYAFLAYAFALGARRSDFVANGPPAVERDAAQVLALLVPAAEPPVEGDALDTLYRVLAELTVHCWEDAVRLLHAVGRPRRETMLANVATALSNRLRQIQQAPPGSARAVLEQRRQELPTRSVLRELAPKTMTRDSSGHPQQRAVSARRVNPRGVDEILDELDRLPGLDTVRAQVRAVLARQQVASARARIGLTTSRPDLHAALVGPPGTGKTMVARLLAELYSAAGLVRRPSFVEAGRQALVGQYVGQSAPRTAEAVATALGGVLFIDEAYSLAGDSYADEAIAELLRLMENHRDDLVVVFAGYPTLMSGFLRQNPGLASRIGVVLHFDAYSNDQLLEILDLQALEDGYLLDAGAQLAAQHWFAAHRNDASFGNARAARQLLATMTTNHALRLHQRAAHDDELIILTAADVPLVTDGSPEDPGTLGYL